jgi:hypothetical protein
MSTPSILIAKPNDWQGLIKAQQEMIRTGNYQRFARLDALCFEVTKLSNPKMLILGSQKTSDGRMAWPGKNWDWLNGGPPIAMVARGGLGDLEFVLPAVPFPMPPDAPDPAWSYSDAVPLPPRIPQRIEDRAMKIKGTPFLIIQPVTQIHWLLDLAVPGHARREIHNVVADGNGLHMAFVYDTQAQTGHLVNGRVL